MLQPRLWCVLFALCPMLALGQGSQIQSPRLEGVSHNTDNPDRLPVKRVVLYKNGVGYFEHLGPVRDNQAAAISFTSGQLNDVLKSLTVLDLNGGRITGVAYGSATPVERQLGDLRLPLTDKPSLSDFLGALRGARVEVRNGQTALTGRLLSIERKTRVGGGTSLEIDYLSLITDSGEVRTTEASPAFSVKLLDRGLPAKIDRYLDLVSSAREADVRRMVISTEGTGDRSLFVSYISEVPVWKATYRIVLNAKAGKNPLLQGWAIVDNTVGQDWDNVQLSLVAGAPQSFVQNLSQPYYARRPVVALPEAMAVAPQTFEATLIPGLAQLSGTITDPTGAVVPGAVVKAYGTTGAVVGETAANEAGNYAFDVLPDGPVRLQVMKQGFATAEVRGVVTGQGKSTRNDVRLRVGSVAEQVSVNASAQTVETASSSLSLSGRSLGRGGALVGRNSSLPFRSQNFTPIQTSAGLAQTVDAARARTEVATLPQEVGDLFEYELKEAITIPKNRSALVPIVQSAIAAEKVSIWNERSGSGRPLRALWLTNSSGLTLDGGTFSVLEEETFAGEGMFDLIRPGEKRLISYATDLAVTVGSRSATEPQRVARVRIHNGVMTQESGIRELKTYTFRNEDASARIMIVEHPVRPGYELRSEAKPVETSAGWMRFRVPVDSKQTVSFAVEEVRPLAATYQISNVTTDQLSLFVREKAIDKTVEAALRNIVAQKTVISALEDQQMTRETEMEKIYDSQQRLRENLKALKDSPGEKALAQRYTRQLNDEEDRLEAIGKEIEDLEQKTEKEQSKLNQMIEDLSFDVALTA